MSRSGPELELGARLTCTVIDGAERDLCFAKAEGGLGIFVQGTCVPGDEVEVEVFHIKKRHVRARLLRVITPSPRREEPRCSWFGRCGGCKWQNFDYAAELELKQKKVNDALQRLGRFNIEAEPVQASPSPYAYRNAITMSFKEGEFGYRAFSDPDTLVPVDHCELVSEPMTALLRDTRRWLAGQDCRDLSKVIFREDAEGSLMVNLLSEAGVDFSEALEQSGLPGLLVNTQLPERKVVSTGEGAPDLMERLGPYPFLLGPNSFFQVNRKQAEVMAEWVREFAAPEAGDHLLELYCGVGALTRFLVGPDWTVEAWEGDAEAVRYARRNLGSLRATVQEANLALVKAFIKKRGSLPDPDIVVLDPPRRGLHDGFVSRIRAWKPRRIVYVSCNPSTFARDAKELCADGAYRLETVRPLDMFPRTAHLELVALLTSRA